MSKPKKRGLYVSRGGEKLEHALHEFGIAVDGFTCADFGSSTGGFTDCLLQHGAVKVYAVDAGYGVLDYKLRTDSRVVVMERTNAMHVRLPEKVDLVTVDASWTRQENILPNATLNLKPEGTIISLIKPHYEKGEGNIDEEEAAEIADQLAERIRRLGIGEVKGPVRSPIAGARAGNIEYLIAIT